MAKGELDMLRNLIAAAALVACSVSVPAAASDCGDARESYNTAIDAVSYALRRYTNCLNASGGTDDCSTEFRRLKYAQGDLESAVSAIGSYCRY